MADLELGDLGEAMEAERARMIDEEFEAIEEEDTSKNVHIVKDYFAKLSALGFFIWTVIMLASNGSGRLKASYNLNTAFLQSSLINDDWVTQVIDLFKDHHVRVPVFLLVPWTIALGVYIASYIIHWWMLRNKTFQDRTAGFKLYAENQGVEPRAIGFNPTFEFAFTLWVPFFEIALIMACGLRDTTYVTTFFGLSFIVAAGSVMVEASSIHTHFSASEYVRANILKFAFLGGFPFIVYVAAFVIQAVVMMIWVFQFPSEGHYYTMILVLGILWLVVKIVLIAIQAIFHIYSYGYIYRGSTWFKDAWSGNYYYNTIRGALVLTIFWVFTIYIYLQAHNMHCLPDWEFCHV